MATRFVRIVFDTVDRASRGIGKVAAALTAVGGIAISVGSVALGRILTTGMRDAVRASAEYESAAVRLAVALNNQGRNTAEARADLDQYAVSLSNVSLATRTQILDSLASATAMGASADVAKDLTAAAVELSSAVGVDVNTAFANVNKTLGGFVEETLSAAVPEIRNLTREQLLAGEAAGVLLEKLGGAGAAGAETLAGALNNLNSTLDAVKVSLGTDFREVARIFVDATTDMVGGSEELVSTFEVLSDRAILAGASALRLAAGLIALSTAIPGVETATKTVSDLIADLEFKLFAAGIGAADFAEKSENDLVKALLAAADEMQGLIGTTRDLGESLGVGEQKVKDLATALDDALRAVGLKTTEELEAQARATAAAFDALRDAQQAGLDVERYEAIREQLVGIAEGLNEAGIAVAGFESETVEADASFRTFTQEANRALAQLTVQAVGRLSDSLIDAAFGADVAWRRFWENFLKQVAAAIVQVSILKAISLAFPSFSIFSFAQGGILPSAGGGPPRAQFGMLIPGQDTGRDSQLILGRPGEAVLPRELTDFLLRAAAGDGQSAMTIRVETSLPAAVSAISEGVESRTLRLVSSELATAGNVR